jgi:hypothetical protein
MVAESNHRLVVAAVRPLAPGSPARSGTRRLVGVALLLRRDARLGRTLGAMPTGIDTGIAGTNRLRRLPRPTLTVMLKVVMAPA